ncbi:MAG: hypothetical protein MHPSP_002154, partial [Paramarteilia canceri]
RVYLNGNNMDDDSIESFENFIREKIKTLKEINIEDCELSEDAQQKIYRIIQTNGGGKLKYTCDLKLQPKNLNFCFEKLNCDVPMIINDFLFHPSIKLAYEFKYNLESLMKELKVNLRVEKIFEVLNSLSRLINEQNMDEFFLIEDIFDFICSETFKALYKHNKLESERFSDQLLIASGLLKLENDPSKLKVNEGFCFLVLSIVDSSKSLPNEFRSLVKDLTSHSKDTALPDYAEGLLNKVISMNV